MWASDSHDVAQSEAACRRQTQSPPPTPTVAGDDEGNFRRIIGTNPCLSPVFAGGSVLPGSLPGAVQLSLVENPT